jgi:hypothetical protein
MAAGPRDAGGRGRGRRGNGLDRRGQVGGACRAIWVGSPLLRASISVSPEESESPVPNGSESRAVRSLSRLAPRLYLTLPRRGARLGTSHLAPTIRPTPIGGHFASGVKRARLSSPTHCCRGPAPAITRPRHNPPRRYTLSILQVVKGFSFIQTAKLAEREGTLRASGMRSGSNPGPRAPKRVR